MVLANLWAHFPPQIATKIMLPNEEFALACRQYYAEEGSIVDSTNGQFAHSPLTRHECDTGYHLLWGHHQHQGLLQSKDLDKCCFFAGDVKKWLAECDYFPDNYFELWDIYERYTSLNGRFFHEQKNGEGKSVRAVNMAREIHKEKDENGKSIVAMKMHLEKDELGRSIHGVKNADKLNREKDELGRSVQGVRNAGRLHREKDELGRSIVAMRSIEKLNAEKTADGKSVQGVKNAERLHEEKDGQGRSVNAVRAAEKVNQQSWKSTVDGHVSTAAGVAKYNRVRGWDPGARVRIA